MHYNNANNSQIKGTPIFIRQVNRGNRMLARALSSTFIGKIRRRLSHFNSIVISLMTYSFVFFQVTGVVITYFALLYELR